LYRFSSHSDADVPRFVPPLFRLFTPTTVIRTQLAGTRLSTAAAAAAAAVWLTN
jgi:hypothetical protein